MLSHQQSPVPVEDHVGVVVEDAVGGTSGLASTTLNVAHVADDDDRVVLRRAAQSAEDGPLRVQVRLIARVGAGLAGIGDRLQERLQLLSASGKDDAVL